MALDPSSAPDRTISGVEQEPIFPLDPSNGLLSVSTSSQRFKDRGKQFVLASYCGSTGC
jgi:hypothetical protein